MKTAKFGIVMLAGALIAISASVSAETLRAKGTVSDSWTLCSRLPGGCAKISMPPICGAKQPNAADCTRACVKKGADYVLVTTDGKVYTLKADTSSPGSTMEALDHVAGQRVEIRGELNGTTVTVRVLSTTDD